MRLQVVLQVVIVLLLLLVVLLVVLQQTIRRPHGRTRTALEKDEADFSSSAALTQPLSPCVFATERQEFGRLVFERD